MLQTQPLQPGGRQHQGAILPLVQLPEPGLKIAPDGPDLVARVQRRQLQPPAEAGRADHRPGRQFTDAFRQHQHVPGILPGGEAQQRQLLRHLHGHVLQTVHRQIRPAVPEGLIQFLHKEALAPHLVQRPVQHLVAGGLHGEQGYLQLRVGGGEMIHQHPALDHRQGALPAANHDFSLHRPNSRAAARAAFRSSLV